MNKTEHKPFPADAEALAKAIAEEPDLIAATGMIARHLTAHAEDSDCDRQAAHILSALGRAAFAPIRAAGDLAAAGGPHTLILQGPAADRLWVFSQLHFAATISPAPTASVLRTHCGELHDYLIRRDPADASHVQPILESLDKRFDIASRVLGPRGLRIISFPSVTLEGSDYELNCEKTDDGVLCLLQIMPGVYADGDPDADLLIYSSAIAALIKVLDPETFPAEGVDELLHRSFAPDGHRLSDDEFMDCFCRGLMMGLCYEAPFGDFAQFRTCSEELRRAWRDFDAKLIRGLVR